MFKHIYSFGIIFLGFIFALYAIPSKPVVFNALSEVEVKHVEAAVEKNYLDGEVGDFDNAKKPVTISEIFNELETEGLEYEVVREVPFYSQFNDISDPVWQKVSCGVASLAMVIDYYGFNISPDTLLEEGLETGAYIDSAGWSHQGLINLSNKYGLVGQTVGLSHMSKDEAFSELEKTLETGPVIASVYYTFTYGHPIPHLVVINAVSDGLVYYNDPAEPAGNGSISIEDFKLAWKNRYIEIRPI